MVSWKPYFNASIIIAWPIETSSISPQSIRVSSYNKPIQMVIYGNTYEELEDIQSRVIGMLRRNTNLSRIETDYTRNKPEVKIIINKW